MPRRLTAQDGPQVQGFDPSQNPGACKRCEQRSPLTSNTVAPPAVITRGGSVRLRRD
jgi:hypothetical protein